jgi:hypothetical protein
MNTSQPAGKKAPVTIGKKAVLNFGLFFIFLAFYLGAALIQTPLLKDIAVMRVAGMPLGLAMSLLIFPVSWIIILVWFMKAR